MKRARSAGAPIRQESDIVISPDGTISISFLWDDLDAELKQKEFSRVKSTRPPSGLEAYPLDEYRRCKACTKACGFNRVARPHPTCGDAQLRVATAGLTLGDEPEIAGSRGSGAVMLSHCPLRCPHCHNPEMVASGNPCTAAGFVDIAWKLADEGAHNLQILSPTVHFPALRYILRALKDEMFPIPIIFKSSGDEAIEQIRSFEGLVDVWLPDLKYGPGSDWAKRAGQPRYFEIATKAIEEMARMAGPPQLDSEGLLISGVLVRHVRAPLPKCEWQVIKQWLDQLGERARVSVPQQFDLIDA